MPPLDEFAASGLGKLILIVAVVLTATWAILPFVLFRRLDQVPKELRELNKKFKSKP
jgi:phosphatidylglycerophosphatase A